MPGGDRIKRGRKQQPEGANQHRAATNARTVAAAGIVASVGLGAFGAGEAQASGQLFACYSKSSKVLEHATSSHCPRGFKSVSWNKAGVVGPQGAQGAKGAQGAQGAQGPAGLVAGYVGSSNPGFPPHAFAAASRTVVATVTPAAAGNYLVNGTATFDQSGTSHSANLKCGIGNGTNSTLITDAHLSHIGALPVTGIIHAGPTSPIELVCEAVGHSGHLVAATVDGVQVATVTRHAAAALQKPNNKFSK